MQGEFGVFVVCSGRVGGKAERGPGRSARRRYAPLEMPYSVPKRALPSASFKSSEQRPAICLTRLARSITQRRNTSRVCPTSPGRYRGVQLTSPSQMPPRSPKASKLDPV